MQNERKYKRTERKYWKEGDNEPQNVLTTKSFRKKTTKSITSWKRCEQFLIHKAIVFSIG